MAFIPTTYQAKELIRVSGSDRFQTALEISRKNIEKSERVIVVSGDSFPDAVSSSALSAENEYPILLTKKDRIDNDLLNEIKRVEAKEILIIGGENSISKSVENELSKVAKTKRISGRDRYETSILVFEYKKELNPNSTKIFFASGKNFADALVAAPLIYNEGSIILYDDGCGIDLKKYSPSLIFGGKNSIPGFDEIKRIAGSDRYETSLEIAREFNSKNIVIASGENFPDALSGALVAKKKSAPIVLVMRDKIEDSLLKYLNENKIETVLILGGTNSVGENIENIILKSLKDNTNNSNKDNNRIDIEDTNPTENTQKPEIKKDELEKEISRAKEIVNSEIEDKAKDNLQKAIAEAEESLKNAKTQEEIDKAIEKLREAIETNEGKVYVNIPDPLFKKVLNKNISMDREDDSPITREELESLKGISIFLDENGNPTFGESFKYSILGVPKSLSGTEDFKFAVTRGIKSIEGIKYCKNLEKLKLNENEISDITELKDLVNLKYIEIQRNRIVDLKPLANLKNLEFLKLYNNLIEDISPLKGLTNLTGLDLHYNVTVKGDENNKIISKGITDISALKDLTKLEFLDISANRIENIEVIKNFKNLKNLDFSGNRVSDYTGLGNLIADLKLKQDEGLASIGFSSQKVTIPNKLVFKENPVSFDNPYKGFHEIEDALKNAYELEDDLNILENISTDIPGITAYYDKSTDKINLTIKDDTLKANLERN